MLRGGGSPSTRTRGRDRWSIRYGCAGERARIEARRARLICRCGPRTGRPSQLFRQFAESATAQGVRPALDSAHREQPCLRGANNRSQSPNLQDDPALCHGVLSKVIAAPVQSLGTSGRRASTPLRGRLVACPGERSAREVLHIVLFPYSGGVQATVTLPLVAVGSLTGAVGRGGRSNPSVALRQRTTGH